MMKALPESPYFQLHEIAAGVYAAIAKDGAGALGNAGFIDLGDEMLIFDTFLTPMAAQDLRNASDALTGKPIAYVVNSHYHGDHVFGNQVFSDACIISTIGTLELMKEKNDFSDLEANLKGFDGYLASQEEKLKSESDERKRRAIELDIQDKRELFHALPTLMPTLPTLTFSDCMTIHGSKRKIELYTFGGGHTPSDAFLLLPEEAIAFTGDLVLVKNNPWMGAGNPEKWLSILDQMEALNINTVVPGHGQPGTWNDARAMKGYITHILAEAKALKEKGVPLEKAVETPVPEQFADWDFCTGYGSNMRFLYERESEKAAK